MTATPRLSLPFLSVGQAQKEFTHNEALQTLDALVGAAVEEPPRATPPASPALGQCYIVADGATDAWAGNSQSIAAWTTGGWRFITPLAGMAVYERSTSTWAVFRSGAWEMGMLRADAVLIGDKQVVGARAAAIDSPVNGSVIDLEARAAVDAILVTLRQHGLIET